MTARSWGSSPLSGIEIRGVFYIAFFLRWLGVPKVSPTPAQCVGGRFGVPTDWTRIVVAISSCRISSFRMVGMTRITHWN